MKLSKKLLAIILAVVSVFSAFVFSACGGDEGGDDVIIDDQGNVRPSVDGKATTITFWGYGDDNEISVFQSLVESFNEKYEGVIEVDYEVKGNDDYSNSAYTALQRSKASVDVLYVGDSDFKRFAELGYLTNLDDFLKTSEEIVIEDMWETSVNRFRYDTTTTTQDGPNAHIWGIPKDIGPTVIYYNETFFNQAGITVISVAAEDLAKFNAGEKDSRGTTKAEYGINGEVKKQGYFIDNSGKKWFNNQIAMSWDECVELSTIIQTTQRDKGRDNFYGYFTEWWFNYGWSVGGDCIEYVPTTDSKYNGGYWEFTLMDDTANYIVADGKEFTVNGTKYNGGEIIAWGDKLNNPETDKTIRAEVTAAKEAGTLLELPSQRDAFVEFVRVGQGTDKKVDGDLYGYGICPAPESINGDAGKTAAFANGLLGMLVDGRWNVVNFRKQMDDKYAWDVAPLPQYRAYDKEGFGMDREIVVEGVEAGHSGSVALCINAKSTKQAAAWKFVEYIGGKTGQTAQSESGFAIPSQKDIANSEVFLQSDKNPRNSIVFVRAAECQTPGDWWYLRDKLWIDPWAGVLNGDVRNGKKTLTQFQETYDYTHTWDLLKEYTKK